METVNDPDLATVTEVFLLLEPQTACVYVCFMRFHKTTVHVN